ncbi:biotin--[acetyl-CoA-carboxylase] ligase [Actinorhabdospora filicis]|uniref:biotin--[biotin carboxyl-carrier protein] ligase n=1 Tax=Actinorhabdospora filicis TaxID=1785913 RepID=A0A9W6SUN2_9ACTN|nr:biotin--[acetyl-CoA-carboxylase] ligase [Actinorhabdospora filicis]GLZ81071.1 biotin--[acetyl-CoA-carboxylase] ligase [Actinorhabdospora filicis]
MTGRDPIDADAVRARLTGSLWHDVRAVPATGSTNADLAALARAGAPEGTVLSADRQDAGRGRLGRGWTSPSGAGLAVSVLLRPTVPPARFGWLTLLAGLSLVEVSRETAGAEAWLKWPNDLLLGPERRKGAGILAEIAPPTGVVLGMGLNVSLTEAELPREDATSLELAGAKELDRTVLLAALLDRLEARYRAWSAAGGDPEVLLPGYLAVCDTIGRPVRAELPDGGSLTGLAETVDTDGRLVIAHRDGRTPVAAADVVHLRPQNTVDT